MDFSHLSPAEIWRLLIPRSHWLYEDDVPEDELIFRYRQHIYFINQDGSVLSLPEPEHLERYHLSALLDHLANSDETYDYDDSGEFDYGAVLTRMGYVVPTAPPREEADYLIEIVDTLDPCGQITRYELRSVGFAFALYHALLACQRLNEQSDGEGEHEVKRITPIRECKAKELHVRH